MRQVLISFVAIGAIAVAMIGLPAVFLPKRWLEVHPGQTRPDVLSLLGEPDADYFLAKSFDGWHNHFYVGAYVLKVTYARDSDIVATVDMRNDWGLAYRHWHQYHTKIGAHSQ